MSSASPTEHDRTQHVTLSFQNLYQYYQYLVMTTGRPNLLPNLLMLPPGSTGTKLRASVLQVRNIKSMRASTMTVLWSLSRRVKLTRGIHMHSHEAVTHFYSDSATNAWCFTQNLIDHGSYSNGYQRILALPLRIV